MLETQALSDTVGQHQSAARAGECPIDIRGLSLPQSGHIRLLGEDPTELSDGARARLATSLRRLCWPIPDDARTVASIHLDPVSVCATLDARTCAQ